MTLTETDEKRNTIDKRAIQVYKVQKSKIKQTINSIITRKLIQFGENTTFFDEITGCFEFNQ